MWSINLYNNDVRYLTENGMFPIVNKTIIKIDAVDNTNNDYKDKTYSAGAARLVAALPQGYILWTKKL